MGAPRHGLLSVVVTDIQDYTRLTNDAPDEMGQVRLLPGVTCLVHWLVCHHGVPCGCRLFGVTCVVTCLWLLVWCILSVVSCLV
jgi:hypothetical protein